MSPRCWSRAGAGWDGAGALAGALLAASLLPEPEGTAQPPVLKGEPRGAEGMKGNDLQKDVPCFFGGFIIVIEGKGTGLVRIPNELCSRKSLLWHRAQKSPCLIKICLCLYRVRHCSGIPAHSSAACRDGARFPTQLFEGCLPSSFPTCSCPPLLRQKTVLDLKSRF